MTEFKIDENLHPDVATVLLQNGHDVVTVGDQDLPGTPDANLAAVCQAEKRALITFDLGFADIRAYPPEEYHGLIVLRLSKQDKSHVLQVFDGIVQLLKKEPLAKHLWVVDDRSARIHK